MDHQSQDEGSNQDGFMPEDLFPENVEVISLIQGS
jgi:hypothetical protein